jgi:uncharacterized membrane protein YhaH (DUF805 family)
LPKEQGVLEKLFSFRGRLSRLAFLGWTAASIALLVLMIVVLMMVGVVGGQTLHVAVAPQLTSLVVGLLMAIQYVWVALALQAKRIRDIGLSPLIVIGTLVAFSIVDSTLLTRLVPAPPIHLFGPQTMIGALVNVAYLCALLFWPGQTKNPERLEETSRDAMIAPRPSMPQNVPLRDAPRATARREFGLRSR